MIKNILITALITTGLNTAVIAQENQQCQSILNSHANQQAPSLTQEEQKTLQHCANTENWCMFYGSNIPNCQNNLHHATTTEISPPPATTTPTPTPKLPPSPPPAAQPKQETNAIPINNNGTTTTTPPPSQPNNHQTKPNINWF